MHLAKKFITSLTNFFDFFFSRIRFEITTHARYGILLRKKKLSQTLKKEISGRERGKRKPRRQEEEKCNKR
jgi:hypothetical protein